MKKLERKQCEHCKLLFQPKLSVQRFCSKKCSGKFQDHPRMDIEKRFWEKVEVQKDDECWNWTGYMDEKGYGKISRLRQPEKAHRTSWKLKYGEIPNGLCVLHTCDNPTCVNPNHLYLGTRKDNSEDAVLRHRTVWGERSSKSKLRSSDVLAIRTLRDIGTPQKIVSQIFGISESHVSGIWHKRFWTHV